MSLSELAFDMGSLCRTRSHPLSYLLIDLALHRSAVLVGSLRVSDMVSFDLDSVHAPFSDSKLACATERSSV